MPAVWHRGAKKGRVIAQSPPAAYGLLPIEQALADAINSWPGPRAAGLDGSTPNRVTDSPLFDLLQVVVTPHLRFHQRGAGLAGN